MRIFIDIPSSPIRARGPRGPMHWRGVPSCRIRPGYHTGAGRLFTHTAARYAGGRWSDSPSGPGAGPLDRPTRNMRRNETAGGSTIGRTRSPGLPPLIHTTELDFR